MKKTLALLLCLVMIMSLFAGCTPKTAAPETPAEEIELVVFAAASMTETMTEIAEQYMQAHQGIRIVCNFGSSGTLKTQIEEGAVCDIFLSAAQKQMNALDAAKDAEANPDGLDFVLEGSRVDLLENKVVLVVPEGNPANIQSFADIANCNLIALGNDDVPVGQYSIEILTNLGLLEGLENGNQITYGSDVKEVTTQVSEGSVDCGIIYATDAFSANLTVVAEAEKDMCKQIIYPGAVMKSAGNPDAAQAFLDFLQTPEAMEIFASVGFAAVN